MYKYYFYSAGILLLVIGFTFVLPTSLNLGEKAFAQAEVQIPANNAAVAGIQKYNAPPYSKGQLAPTLTARAILVKDLNTDTILYQNNAYNSVPVASTTK